MLKRLTRSWRLIAFGNTKPLARIKERANWKLVGRTTLNYRDYSLKMLLKLCVSKNHNALATPNARAQAQPRQRRVNWNSDNLVS